MTTLVRTTLDKESTEITAQHLQESLFDLLELTLQAKQAHWNVIGPRFRTVHLHLDELVEVTRSFSDAVAERIVTLGVPANGLSGQIANQTKLDAMPTGYVKDEEVVKQITDRLASICHRTRENAATIEERDPVSADLLIGQLAKLEEQMWMFHAQAQ